MPSLVEMRKNCWFMAMNCRRRVAMDLPPLASNRSANRSGFISLDAYLQINHRYVRELLEGWFYNALMTWVGSCMEEPRNWRMELKKEEKIIMNMGRKSLVNASMSTPVRRTESNSPP
jgi:hypothetical protein